MSVIRQFAELRKRTHELSRICNESGEPIFITKNGECELVLMSVAAYERLRARLDLYCALAEAEEDAREGDRGVTVSAMRRKL